MIKVCILDLVNVNGITEQFLVVAEQNVAWRVEIHNPLRVVILTNFHLLETVDSNNVEVLRFLTHLAVDGLREDGLHGGHTIRKREPRFEICKMCAKDLLLLNFRRLLLARLALDIFDFEDLKDQVLLGRDVCRLHIVEILECAHCEGAWDFS